MPCPSATLAQMKQEDAWERKGCNLGLNCLCLDINNRLLAPSKLKTFILSELEESSTEIGSIRNGECCW